MATQLRVIGPRLFSRLGFWLLVAAVVAVVSFPLVWMGSSSLKPSDELFKTPPSILPNVPTLKWYAEAFGDSEALRYSLNSLVIATATTLLCVVLGTLGAYGLARFEYRGRKAIIAGILMAYCIPPIMLMTPLYRLIAGAGLNSSYLGVIVGHFTITFPFCLWLLISFFEKIPKEIEESASVDGASIFTIFFRIDLPLCMPGILSAGIMVFILSWNEYLLASVLVSSDTMKTLTVGLANYISSTEINWGAVMAIGTATTIPIIILFTAVQKYFVEGMTAGSVKG
ncbi:MAG: carbohydrate ABC transporter permease [Propionibacteriaceae bacterium]|nr:carbohydrate ABC transporter permease [Propionibacteriaceae bacterium]